MKGVGESGVGATLGALCGAIENAFPELDLRLDELVLTPGRVWRALRDARQAAEGPGDPQRGAPVGREVEATT
jgi:hypothetical protein